MITTTQHHEKADRIEQEKNQRKDNRSRLFTLFREIDKDGNGHLCEAEFDALLEDPGFCEAFCEATSLQPPDMKDLFRYLSHGYADGEWRIDYKDFIYKVQCEGKEVSEQSVFRLEKQMRLLEHRMDEKLENVWTFVKSGKEEA